MHLLIKYRGLSLKLQIIVIRVWTLFNTPLKYFNYPFDEIYDAFHACLVTTRSILLQDPETWRHSWLFDCFFRFLCLEVHINQILFKVVYIYLKLWHVLGRQKLSKCDGHFSFSSWRVFLRVRPKSDTNLYMLNSTESLDLSKYC